AIGHYHQHRRKASGQRLGAVRPIHGKSRRQRRGSAAITETAMKNIVQFPDLNVIQEEAALWLAKMDGGELSDDQRQQLQAWLDSDHHHGQALSEMAELWGQMDALAVLAELFP